MYWRTAEDTNDGDATRALREGMERGLARSPRRWRDSFARPRAEEKKRWEKGERGLTCPASAPPPSYGSSILIASAWVQCWHTGESSPYLQRSHKPGSAGISQPLTLTHREQGKKQICHARAAISHNRSVGGKGKNRGCTVGGRLAASQKGVAVAPLMPSAPIPSPLARSHGEHLGRVHVPHSRDDLSRDAP